MPRDKKTDLNYYLFTIILKLRTGPSGLDWQFDSNFSKIVNVFTFY